MTFFTLGLKVLPTIPVPANKSQNVFCDKSSPTTEFTAVWMKEDNFCLEPM